MQDLVEGCSSSLMSFKAEDNIVIGPIDISCDGIDENEDKNEFDCDVDNPLGPLRWAVDAEDIVRMRNTVQLDHYDRHIFILPNLPECGWAGLGTLGCEKDRCRIWINNGGVTMKNLDIIWHEIGHTMGLYHSGVPGNEYGDCTCAMGNCGVGQCFNAAQSWQLGWVLPIDDLDASSLTPGIWLKYYLPALQIGDSTEAALYRQCLLRIRATWGEKNNDDNAFIISYREAVNSDRLMQEPYTRHIHVHSYVTNPSTFTGNRVTLLSSLSSSQEFVDREENFRIRFLGIKGFFAGVQVCRWIQTVSECESLDRVIDKSPNCYDVERRSDDGIKSDVLWEDSEKWQKGGCVLEYSPTHIIIIDDDDLDDSNEYSFPFSLFLIFSIILISMSFQSI